MSKIIPVARRIAQIDAGYRTSDATTSKGKILLTQTGMFPCLALGVRKSETSDLRVGRLCLEQGRRCDHLVVMDTTAVTAPSLVPGKTGQIPP